MFFSFDGIDGVGKSTQMDLFCEWLEGQGSEVVVCRDPGSTVVGENIRNILLHTEPSIPFDDMTEMLLYMSARAQLVAEVISPALEAGKVLVSDRYLLANLVYQGHAGVLDIETIREIGETATRGIHPDCVFVLDMPPKDARTRLDRELDRMELRGEAFQEKLRTGFLKEAEQDGGKSIFVINAAQPIEKVQADIVEVAKGKGRK